LLTFSLGCVYAWLRLTRRLNILVEARAGELEEFSDEVLAKHQKDLEREAQEIDELLKHREASQ
jgi:hypothetical protein